MAPENMQWEQLEQQAAAAARELLQKAHVPHGGIVVVGCSTSEIMGGSIGKASSMAAAGAVYRGLAPVLAKAGVFLAAQCCEHLNRAIVLEQAALKPWQQPVNVLPQPHAGGSFATTAWQNMKAPTALEAIEADAGLDIGDTLIGMHLKHVAVPVDAVREKMAAAMRAAGRKDGSVLLCAASKTQSAQVVRAAAGCAIDLFGENRVQELTEKLAAGAYGAKPVHMIGHLQTNKVKYVVGHAALIHSVDSARLVDAIEKEAAKLGVVQDILLEVNIGAEESKSGVAPCEVRALAEYAAAKPHVLVRGLMAIPPVEEAEGQARRYFAQMKQLFDKLADAHIERAPMEVLSMGMSADFESAILEGATLVRVGTAIFGARSYPA